MPHCSFSASSICHDDHQWICILNINQAVYFTHAARPSQSNMQSKQAFWRQKASKTAKIQVFSLQFRSWQQLLMVWILWAFLLSPLEPGKRELPKGDKETLQSIPFSSIDLCGIHCHVAGRCHIPMAAQHASPPWHLIQSSIHLNQRGPSA